MGNSVQAHRVAIGLFACRMSSSSWSSSTGAYKMSRLVHDQETYLLSWQKLLLVVVTLGSLVHAWNQLTLPGHHHQPIELLSQGSRVGTVFDIGESVMERTAGQVRMLLLLSGNVESNPGPDTSSVSLADLLPGADQVQTRAVASRGFVPLCCCEVYRLNRAVLSRETKLSVWVKDPMGDKTVLSGGLNIIMVTNDMGPVKWERVRDTAQPGGCLIRWCAHIWEGNTMVIMDEGKFIKFSLLKLFWRDGELFNPWRVACVSDVMLVVADSDSNLVQNFSRRTSREEGRILVREIIMGDVTSILKGGRGEDRTIPILAFYLHNVDLPNAFYSISELYHIETTHWLVKFVFNTVVEKKDDVKLFGFLLKNEFLTRKEFVKSVNAVLEFAENLFINIPNFSEYYGGTILVEETVDLTSPCLAASTVFTQMGKIDQATTVELCQGSGLSFAGVKMENRDWFVMDNKFDFLTQSVVNSVTSDGEEAPKDRQMPHTYMDMVDLPPDSGLSESIPFHSNIRGSWQIKFVGAKLRGGAPDPLTKQFSSNKSDIEKEDMFADSDDDLNETATDSKESERESRAPRREMDHHRNLSERSSRSQSSGEEDAICVCGRHFGRKSSLVRHFNTKCAMNAELNKDVTSGMRNERSKRSSTKSPLLTPRSSGAKRPMVRNDGDVCDEIHFVTYEEDGKTEQLLKSKLETLFSVSAHLGNISGSSSLFAQFQLAQQMGKCCSGCHPVLFNWRPRPVSEPKAARLPDIAAVSSRYLDGVLLLERVLIDAKKYNVYQLRLPKQARIKMKCKL